MGNLYDASAIALGLFMALAFVDGVYLHLVKYKLHTRPESRREHKVHTVAALLFTLTLPTLYLWPTAGLLLWAGVALLVVDVGVEILDMGIERESRASLGGLSSFEYILHVVVTSARAVSVALALAARPAAAWALEAPLVMGELPWLASFVAWQALPGAVVMTAVHVALMHPRFAGRPAAPTERTLVPQPASQLACC